MNFASDNAYGALPEVWAAVQAADRGAALAYGNDAITKSLTSRFADLFERDVAVFPVLTGTAANALALACVTPPYGAVLCHRDSHIMTSECGAPEFFSGAKLMGLEGAESKLAPKAIEEALASLDGSVHSVQPSAVSLSQASELGTVYSRPELSEIGALAHDHGLKLHMDGARFANAMAHLGCSPAEATWKCGVDVLSFGLTKNGAAAAEAVIFFDAALAQDFAYRRKRTGHLFSKMRFVSAQFEALLADGLWLRLAAQANAMAARLAEGLAQIPDARLLHPVEANELFVLMPEPRIAVLERAGFLFYRWECAEGPCIRLVTAFDTEPAHIDGLLAALSAL